MQAISYNITGKVTEGIAMCPVCSTNLGFTTIGCDTKCPVCGFVSAWRKKFAELAVHHSDYRSVDIIVTGGAFNFIGELRMYGLNLVQRTLPYKFAAGEQVLFNGTIKNIGTAYSNARIDHDGKYFIVYNVRDGDTVDISPPGTAVVVGTMPNHDWTIGFTLTP